MIYAFVFLVAVGFMAYLLATPEASTKTHHNDPEMNGQLLRGTRVLSTSHGAEIVAIKGGELGATLAGIPIPKSIEVNSFLFAGGPGSGKSLAFVQMLQYARAEGHRAIVVDNGGDLLSRLYRPCDVILNPLDTRSEAWSLFSEMRETYDALRLSKSVVPDADGPAAEWTGYGQQLVAAVLQRLWEKGGVYATTEELVRVLTVAPIEELQELCAGLPAITMMSGEIGKMFGSIRAIVGSKLAVYPYLQKTDKPFSLTDFIQGEGSSFVFLTYRDDQFSMLSPLIAAQLDVCISALLSMGESRKRRVWFALDEFATLGRISSIEPLLSKGRKYGGSTILGLQSISQLTDAYNREKGQTILSCLGTWLVLRSPDADTAEYMARFLGKQELLRTTKSHRGGNDQGEGWSQSVAEAFTVMPSTLQNLPDCQGFLSLVGDYHPFRVRVPFLATIADQAKAFILRDLKTEAQIDATARAEATAEADKAQIDDILKMIPANMLPQSTSPSSNG